MSGLEEVNFEQTNLTAVQLTGIYTMVASLNLPLARIGLGCFTLSRYNIYKILTRSQRLWRIYLGNNDHSVIPLDLLQKAELNQSVDIDVTTRPHLIFDDF